jgi:hypothetical protein
VRSEVKAYQPKAGKLKKIKIYDKLIKTLLVSIKYMKFPLVGQPKKQNDMKLNLMKYYEILGKTLKLSEIPTMAAS